MSEPDSRPSSAPILIFFAVALVLILIAGGAIYAFIHLQEKRHRAINDRIAEDLVQTLRARKEESDRLRDEIMRLKADLDEANRRLAAAPPPASSTTPPASPGPTPSPAVSFDAHDEDVISLLALIGKTGQMQVVVDKEVSERRARITLKVDGMPCDQALRLVCERAGFKLVDRGDGGYAIFVR